jgi:hypothetical protein
MRAFALCAAVLAALTSTAEAGKREKCAASSGATSGAAVAGLNECGKSQQQSAKKLALQRPRKPRAMQDGQLLICRGGASVGGHFHSS